MALNSIEPYQKEAYEIAHPKKISCEQFDSGTAKV